MVESSKGLGSSAFVQLRRDRGVWGLGGKGAADGHPARQARPALRGMAMNVQRYTNKNQLDKFASDEEKQRLTTNNKHEIKCDRSSGQNEPFAAGGFFRQHQQHCLT
jgi:hypothetical protein